MAVSLDQGKRKGVNVELNIVPFIDLMSCLTAFLLVTAAWVNTAALDVQPKGKSRDGKPCDTDECVYLSVLVEPEAIWVGRSRTNELDRIPTTASGPDFAKLGERLRELRKHPYWGEHDAIEIAVESSGAKPMTYQAMVGAMDTAVASGFRDVGITDPNGLTTRPTL